MQNKLRILSTSLENIKNLSFRILPRLLSTEDETKVILIGLKHKPSKGGSKKECEETKLVNDSNILTSTSTFMDGTNSIFGSTVNCTEVERKSHAENTKTKTSKSKSKVKEGSEKDFMDIEDETLDILNEIQNFTD